MATNRSSKFRSNSIFVTRISWEREIAFECNRFHDKSGNFVAQQARVISSYLNISAQNSSVACGFLLNPRGRSRGGTERISRREKTTRPPSFLCSEPVGNLRGRKFMGLEVFYGRLVLSLFTLPWGVHPSTQSIW